MSLDVTLSLEPETVKCVCSYCLNEHTRVDAREVYSSNITHNLNLMADAAGIYKELWRPEEVGITKASQLIEPLKKGLERLESSPSHFEQFNASNGWGMYKHFVPFVREYLNACIENPDANVSVSR